MPWLQEAIDIYVCYSMFYEISPVAKVSERQSQLREIQNSHLNYEFC